MDPRALIELMQSLLQAYGLLGLVIGLMLVSILTTFIPLPMDLVVLYIVGKGFDPALVAFAAAVGTTLAACVDYLIGYIGSGWIIRRMDQEKFARTNSWLERWGSIAIFSLSLLPAPFEIVAVAVGALRMRFWKFVVATFAGKIIKYGVFAFFGSVAIEMVKAYISSVIP